MKELDDILEDMENKKRMARLPEDHFRGDFEQCEILKKKCLRISTDHYGYTFSGDCRTCVFTLAFIMNGWKEKE